MRIISGEARGRRLVAPAGQGTRPTADRIREAIFNLLGQRLDGEEVLDLFAGSGAMGLEALSRGASRATFVDKAKEAMEACKTNVEALGYGERALTHRADALSALRRLGEEGASFDLAFVDPPYGLSPEPSLETLGGGNLLRPGGLVVAEHEGKRVLGERYGSLVRRDARRYGATAITLFEAESEVAP